MLGKIFGQSGPDPIPGDRFALGSLCEEYGLAEKSREIVQYSRGAVEVRLAEFDSDLAHTASRVGGLPALPDDVDWPLSNQGSPMSFVAQLSCGELATEGHEGLPDEGLLSIFLDTTKAEPNEAQVYYYSLARDMRRRQAPEEEQSDVLAYRPTFHAVASLPRPGSDDFEKLALDETEQENFLRLLRDYDRHIQTSSLYIGGHTPLRLEAELPEEPTTPFLLALHDLSKLFQDWPEGGWAFLGLPTETKDHLHGPCTLFWQVDESWDEDEDWDDEEDEWED